MLHLAMKAFYPEKPPFPFMHIDTTWKFKDMIKFRDETAKKLGIEMIVYTNEDGVKQGINPFDHGAAYTDIMKTQALKQALTKYGFTAAFGGGRRDEEKSRAKERIFSFRNEAQAWDPKNQRPEMWKLYNTKIKKGESMPCIAWGRNARTVSELPVGSRLYIQGRIQSRRYQKQLSDGTVQDRTAHEVSCSSIELL